jgi:molybdenum cofactor sulfurtransferase
VEATREAVLDYFKANDDYLCIFTANATGALKIVGESYPFEHSGHFLLALDNHNSVNGIREFAKSKGAGFSYTPLNAHDLRLNEEELEKNLSEFSQCKNRLFAYPLQSNVSGVKHPLKWIQIAQEKGWDVLADAAAFVPYNRLDLREIQPDFVSVSFYKIFGYPTGIGCLLVRKSSFSKLRKPWFAGGTITAVSALGDGYIFDESHARFEDGTLNYLEIPAVQKGLAYMNELGIHHIENRVNCLGGYLLRELQALKHDNGRAMIQIYGPKDTSERGATIIFNCLDPEGNIVAYEAIEQEAGRQKISLRTGCFCNPGIDEANNCLMPDELADFFKMRDKGDYKDMISFIGRLRGAIRISLGMVSNFEDIRQFYVFISSFKNRAAQEILSSHYEPKNHA